MILTIINGLLFGAMVGVVLIMSLFWGAASRKMRQDIERWEQAKREYLRMRNTENGT